MFEKDAEFYAREKYSPKTDSFIVAVADDAFKDGAEYGYNKAKEEMQAQIDKMKCCSNCKNCRRKFIKKNVFENTCKVEHCRNYDK